MGTFGGLGAAGLSASLLTSVLPTTLEDLLALGLCSAGGFIAISTFPVRRQAIVDKVNKIADGLAREVEEAMQNDLMETVGNLENFVKTIGKPYQDAAQERLDKLLDLQDYQMLIKNYALKYKMFMYHDKMILSLNFITGQFSLRYFFF